MVKATKTEVRIPQPPIMQPVPQPDKIETKFLLELGEEEAWFLMGIFGNQSSPLVSDDKLTATRKIGDNICYSLAFAGANNRRPLFTYKIQGVGESGVWKLV